MKIVWFVLLAAVIDVAPACARVTLGTAETFAVLGSSTVTSTGTTEITGNLGVYPGTSVVGFPPGTMVLGDIHAGDTVAMQAQADAASAYTAMATFPCGSNITGQDLGGLTLKPGVYCFDTSAQLTGTLTLDFQGNCQAIFLFQIGSTLTTAANSAVKTINCNQHCFANWQVGSSATLGVSTSFYGNILANASITLTTNVSVRGRLLALHGAVTMDTDNVDFMGTLIPPPVQSPETGVSLTNLGPSESVLYSFAGQADGGNPNGFVIFDRQGGIYGTTLAGGKASKGSVYKLIPGANGYTERVLYSFTGASDGGSPASGLLIDDNGALYGTTEASNGELAGVVFKLTPPSSQGGTWVFSALYNFTGGADGGFPNSSLVFDAVGALYGTTTKGGAGGSGTVFKLAPPESAGLPWTQTVLYSFTGGMDGAIPYAPVLFDQSGNLFGTTVRGGASQAGTIFELLAPASSGGAYTFESLYSFTNGADGSFPYAGLAFDSATDPALYGTAFGGGSGYGVAFSLNPPAVPGGAWVETVLHSFTGLDGSNPSAGMTYLPATNSFYGTTFAVAGHGVVFSLSKPVAPAVSWTYTVIHGFTGTPDGSNPLAAVTLDCAGNLFGTTYLGGSFGAGAVFELVKSAPCGC